MSRLIDADALMVVLEKIPAVGFKNIDNQTYTLVLLAQVLNIIKKQPTIEPEHKKIALDGEALMEAFYSTPKERRNWDEAWALINRAKLAKPERTRGRWIENGIGIICCSICSTQRRDNRVNHLNFCNSCGADMRGGDNESDRF